MAGSDTTASTLTYAFYEFAQHPELIVKLRKELEVEGMMKEEDVKIQALCGLPYLNAVINETLRLHPPVPGGLHRDTPAEGVVMNGQHLSGGVHILGPTHTIHRCIYQDAHPSYIKATC